MCSCLPELFERCESKFKTLSLVQLLDYDLRLKAHVILFTQKQNTALLHIAVIKV